jgi:trehalose synthase
VVAGAVGGIPLQIIDGETGFLVDPTDLDQTADRVVTLLADPALASAMAARGVEHVREHFLVTRLLGHYLSLFQELMD